MQRRGGGGGAGAGDAGGRHCSATSTCGVEVVLSTEGRTCRASSDHVFARCRKRERKRKMKTVWTLSCPPPIPRLGCRVSFFSYDVFYGLGCGGMANTHVYVGTLTPIAGESKAVWVVRLFISLQRAERRQKKGAAESRPADLRRAAPPRQAAPPWPARKGRGPVPLSARPPPLPPALPITRGRCWGWVIMLATTRSRHSCRRLP